MFLFGFFCLFDFAYSCLLVCKESIVVHSSLLLHIYMHAHIYCLLGVKASALRAADLGLIPAFGVDLSLGRVIPVTLNLIIQWLACQAPCVVLGLVGPVLVYHDWVR